MKTPEILKGAEFMKSRKTETRPWDSSLTTAAADAVSAERRKALVDLKSLFSLKFYYQVVAKLEREQREFRVLLNISAARDESLARYSFVLDPSYFEQKLWKP